MGDRRARYCSSQDDIRVFHVTALSPPGRIFALFASSTSISTPIHPIVYCYCKSPTIVAQPRLGWASAIPQSVSPNVPPQVWQLHHHRFHSPPAVTTTTTTRWSFPTSKDFPSWTVQTRKNTIMRLWHTQSSFMIAYGSAQSMFCGPRKMRKRRKD